MSDVSDTDDKDMNKLGLKLAAKAGTNGTNHEGQAAPDAPKEIKIIFRVPDVITYGTWEVFNRARSKYLEGKQKNEVDDWADPNYTDFVGAMALIEAGVVGLEAPEGFKRNLLNWRVITPPTPVIGLVNRMVSQKLKDSFSGPLPESWMR